MSVLKLVRLRSRAESLVQKRNRVTSCTELLIDSICVSLFHYYNKIPNSVNYPFLSYKTL